MEEIDKEKFWDEFFLFHDYVMLLVNYDKRAIDLSAIEDLERERIDAHKAIANYYGVVKDDLNGVLHNIDLNEVGADIHLWGTVKELISKGLIRKTSSL